MDSDNPTAVRFRALMGYTDLSFNELDQLAGAKASGHAVQISNGSEPRMATAKRFAAVLGCSPGWLISGEGKRPLADDVRAAVEVARVARKRREESRA